MPGVSLQDLQAEVASISSTRATFVVNGREFVLVSKPITPADMGEITKRHRDFATNPNMEGMVDLLIRKCRDAEDETVPAFTQAHKPWLMRMTTVKIGELFADLFGAQMETVADEEIEKHMGN